MDGVKSKADQQEQENEAKDATEASKKAKEDDQENAKFRANVAKDIADAQKMKAHYSYSKEKKVDADDEAYLADQEHKIKWAEIEKAYKEENGDARLHGGHW